MFSVDCTAPDRQLRWRWVPVFDSCTYWLQDVSRNQIECIL